EEVADEPSAAWRRPDHDKARAATRSDAMTILGYGLTLVGLVVVAYFVYVLGVTRLENGKSQRTLRSEYATMLANQQAYIGGPIPAGTPVAELRIPRIGINQIVVEGTTGRVLEQGPGHLRSSPLPGQHGNSV